MINSNESFLTEFIKPLSSHANCLADGVIQSILLVILSRDSKKKKRPTGHRTPWFIPITSPHWFKDIIKDNASHS